MELSEATQLISDFEVRRWRASVLERRPITRPIMYLLADFRRGPITINTMAGPLAQLPASYGVPEWCFFADDEPGANWQHPCRYLFLFADAEIYSVAENAPPYFDDDRELEKLTLRLFPFGEKR